MTDEIIIRELRSEDLEDALNLWKISFAAGFSSSFDKRDVLERYLIRNPGLSTAAFVKDNRLIGALLCGHDGRRGSIYHTAVYPDYRGMNIGRKMEARALEKLRDEGITTGFLFINVKNPGSKEFWETIGWSVAEEVRYLYKEL